MAEVTLDDVDKLVKMLSGLFTERKYKGKAQPCYDGAITHVKFEFSLNAKEIKDVLDRR